MRLLSMLVLVILMSACASTPMEYKRADLSMYEGLHGYLDQEISPGVYVIEVTQRGGYQFINDYEGTVALLKSYWFRRAGELCPRGFDGEPSVVKAYQAQIKEIYCDLRFCQNYPVISGMASCHNQNAT